MALSPQPDDRILSVGELTRAIQETLADSYPAVWVRGEVSGLSRPPSGHLYFSLKEGTQAVLSCVAFRGTAQRLTFDLQNGIELEAFGSIDVYAPRGGYQLKVSQMRPAGLGALLLQLEELKRRLAAEGLFDAARKRPLPPYPRVIGVVTSPVGAAVRDIVKVLRARWPAIRIVLAPVKVQGAGAAAEIASAIERFNRWGGADLLIVGRGGGSLEDLWAFNEEATVRAIAGSQIPVISAVGHEVDTTLADHAADVRAATPSNAAELAVRDARELDHRVLALRERAIRAARLAVTSGRRDLEAARDRYRFRRVRDLFDALQQRVDELGQRARGAVHGRLEQARERLVKLSQLYGLREFPRALAGRRVDLTVLAKRLTDGSVGSVFAARRRVSALEDRLRALSPRAVLERGYTLVRSPDGRLVRSVGTLAKGDPVLIEFARGEAAAIIQSTRTGGSHATEEDRS